MRVILPKWARRLANTALAVAAGVALVPALHGLPLAAEWFRRDHEKLASAATLFEALVVAATAIIAYLAYRSAMRTVAKQNTLERIFEDHSDREVVDQRKLFRRIKNSSDDKLENYSHSKHREAFVQRRLREVAKAANNGNGNGATPAGGAAAGGNTTGSPQQTPPPEPPDDQRIKYEKEFDDYQTAIFGVLNRYETFAIGISEKAIDTALYKRWWRNQFIADWHDARSTIEKMRTEHESPKLFVEFEELAKRWEREAYKEKHRPV